MSTIFLRSAKKKGYSISPFLFNAVLEQLPLELEHLPVYNFNEGSDVYSLAFDDGLVLLADAEQAKDQLFAEEAYVGGLAMTICFQITPTKDSWIAADPVLALRSGEEVP
jgi:hypothetical protein